ncbi:MAG: deoxyribodipyrimidine photo-lyase [Bryobacteraceae bacterium]
MTSPFEHRVSALNDCPARRDAAYVLYWAQMNRRVESNHGLEYAVERANERGLPVLFYEGLTCDYLEANARLHTFIVEGAPETARRAAKRGIGYCFYLRKRKSDPNDVLYRLAAKAALVVTDDYPVFINARHNRRVPAKLDVPFIAVESSCVVPMRFFATKQYGAYTLRPRLHKVLDAHLRPLDAIPVKREWTSPPPEFHTPVTAANVSELVAACEIDHSVKPSLSFGGGRAEAEKHLRLFIESNLARYDRDRNEPAAHATSDLSPYLHFGHISATEAALAARLFATENGASADAFLEELIVRRELAFNHALHSGDRVDSLQTLPDWARKTLASHDGDHRDPVYTYADFEHARTHDALWNACQKEMLLRGKIHGYYRMYWGKKIIEWSASHREACETMVRIHDRYALDGRDPNTYTNILWCFGLHDRPWQERPIFGMVRYMSLEGMKRKTGVDAYLREIGWLEATGADPRAGSKSASG